MARYLKVIETSNYDEVFTSWVLEKEFYETAQSTYFCENLDGSYTYANPDSEVTWTIRAYQVRG